MLVEMIEGKKVIVYMDFIQDVTRLVVALQGVGIEAAAFHGKKLSSTDKKIIIRKCKASEVQVIVATRAFGMGVNVSDVDMVVRVGCPSSIEDMVQEFGRAGRDGRLADCEYCYSVINSMVCSCECLVRVSTNLLYRKQE